MKLAEVSTRTRHLIIVAVIFLGSRAAVIASGVYFRGNAGTQDQLLDAKELAAHPFLAFTSNHIQPPLWNFFVGAVMRWSPFPSGISFQMIYLAVGLLTVLCLWEVLRGLGARQWIATVATTLVGLSPPMILNGSILRYEMLEAAILTIAALTFLRYVRKPTPARLAMFAGILLVGVLTRTTLQPLWLLGGLIVVLVCRPPRGWWRSALGISGIALILVVAPLVHRSIAFGTFGFSSFWGMNLHRITTMQLPESDVNELVDQGKLSRLAPINRRYEIYAPYLPTCSSHTGNPVLDDLRKNSGDTNFNALCMLPFYEIRAKDSLTTIRSRPRIYLRSVGQATILYTTWRTSNGRSGLLDTWDRIYAPVTIPTHVWVTLGSGDPQPVPAIFSPARLRVSITIVLALVLAIALGLQGTWRVFRGRADVRDRLRVFIGFTVVSLTAVSVTMDFFENSRFREPLDPLLLGPLFVFVLEGLVQGIARVRGRHVGVAHSDADAATPGDEAGRSTG